MEGPQVPPRIYTPILGQMLARKRRQAGRGMRGQSRESMALECLTLLLDLADHKDTCDACKRGVKDFCRYERQYGPRYSQLIAKIYSGKHARKPVTE